MEVLETNKDNTVLAISTAVKNIIKEEADDYFVLVLSDANLNQYNISAHALNEALQTDSRVNAHIVFIGNIANQADRLTDQLSGNAFMCLDTKALPKIIKSIFVYSLTK